MTARHHAPSTATQALIDLENEHGAHNYHPLPLAAKKALGSTIWDVDGRELLDFMSAYSAVSLGHSNPILVKALVDQAGMLAVTSRAYHNEILPRFLEELCAATGMDKALPMNSGAEAVETAIKACRKWGQTVKGIAPGHSKIIVCANNFHGRTTTIVGFSSEAQYREGFGPFDGGFIHVPFGDEAALEAAMSPEVCAFIFEPIQGEAGIVIAPDGYLASAERICRAHHVLLVADEIQTGFARTGIPFAHRREIGKVDAMILGKALGGGLLPISALVGTHEVMGVFHPGDHGSTFGGNPLACAVARAAIPLLMAPELSDNSARLGERLLQGLRLRLEGCPFLVDIRGRGLFAAVEVTADVGARSLVVSLLAKGIVSKETHGTVLRLAPPLNIQAQQIDRCVDMIAEVFSEHAQETGLAWRSA